LKKENIADRPSNIGSSHFNPHVVTQSAPWFGYVLVVIAKGLKV
jgi:hypothetical protein